jgi:N-acetylglucosamine malate deacetylase 1
VEALILVAHADDETLGCGGFIRKLIKKGWSTRVVVMSDGVFFRDKTEDNRAGLKAACEILGVHDFQQMGFKDQRFDQVPMADLVDSVLRLELDPDLIITHVDTDLNNDHRLTCEVAKIVGRPRRKPVSIIGCEIPNSSFWNGAAFPANYYVDVTEEIDTKIKAFSAYENEVRPFPHPWSEKGLRLLAEYHGMQCGFRYAEAYSIIRAYEGRLP